MVTKINPREHFQNVKSSLKLVIHDSNAMIKILPIIFYWSLCVWYLSLKPSSILSFVNLGHKLIVYFSMNIPTEKAQLERERTEAYLKRFNKEMLKVENLLEPVVIFLSINNGYIGTISQGI
jgi:hypothetical protein